jgi:hypothetical protein
MADVKISALPTFTGTANDSAWYVVDNSTLNVTYRYSGYTSPFRRWGNTNVAPTYYTTDVAGNTNGYNGIIAGLNHSINANAFQSFIAGGDNNDITGAIYRGVLLGGNANVISSDNDNQILGGGSNTIGGGYFATIINGRTNTMTGNYSRDSLIGCGVGNTMTASDKSNIITSENAAITNAGAYTSMISCSGGSITSSGKYNAIIASDNGRITGTTKNAVMLGVIGRAATRNDATFVENLVLFNYSNLNYSGDSAAAAGGVVLGQLYHDNGNLRVRIA